MMPRNELSKEELKCYLLQLKLKVDDDCGYPGEKTLVHKYLNKVIDKIDTCRY